MEKLFTSLLNSRLNKLSDDIGLISGVQGREGVTSVGPYVLKYSLIKDKSLFN
jgi:hypothetical protein